MSIDIVPRNDRECYIDYSGNSFSEYLDFASLLGDVKSRDFDSSEKRWYCNKEDARRMNQKIRARFLGNDLKLSPYQYQREALVFTSEETTHGIIQLPCGAGKILPFREHSAGFSE